MSIFRSRFIALGLILSGLFSAQAARSPFPSTNEKVGRTGAGRIVTPVNQVVTPRGKQVDLPGLRPIVLALSPDGKLLVTSGKTSELVVIDPVTGEIRQRVALPSEQANEPQPESVSGNILQPD